MHDKTRRCWDGKTIFHTMHVTYAEVALINEHNIEYSNHEIEITKIPQ
jgi:hypothetical protein